ncbi:unnamed protein product [Notodromas monacha]|uniref:C2 domain-containing protein n=1 Tax=Notodromas monacha TaxID=399045 RepID=A0A7R9BY38_9CRUS|nr:unnamed protein product [Notodromas monacha]CAG0922562.1 unnamed protein product [Notodromas monacha]
MPGRVKVRIVAGRNLPVMDRTNETTDAYVEVRFGSTTYKTEVCRKTLSPQWNSEWFRFETQISIGDKLLIGVATGTACYFAALPPPTVPRILASHSSSSMKSENGDGDSSVSDIQKKLCELVAANKKTFGLAKTPEIIEAPRMALERAQRVSDSDDEHLPHLDLSAGNKDTCVLEIDDCEDLDVINLLMDPKPPLDFEVSNIEDYICNGRSKTSNPQDTFVESDDELPQNQLFTKIWRGNVTPPFTSKDLSRIMDRLIHGTCYRFRKAEPKIVRMVRVNVTSVEEDELQVILTGVSLGTPSFSYNMNHWKKLSASTEPSVESDAETVKSLKESSDGACETELKPSTSSIGRKPSSNLTLTVPDSGVNRIVAENSFELPTPVLITPLTWIHGKKPESYLGNLNFFFVRETMNVKEFHFRIPKAKVPNEQLLQLNLDIPNLHDTRRNIAGSNGFTTRIKPEYTPVTHRYGTKG